MGERQFNHKEALARAYGALYTLRKEGKTKPPVTEIAKRSGLQRSTMYTDHPDWQEFREIVRLGLPTKEATEAGVALEEKADWLRRVELVEQRVAKADEGVEAIKQVADAVYTKLTAQLHKYVMLSKETPNQLKARAAMLRENAEMKQDNQRLKDENAELRLNTSIPANLRPLAKKEVLSIYEELPVKQITDSILEDSVIDASNSLGDYFATAHESRIPLIVYILCGNFASGKSRWIKEHSPLMPGVNLYLDGTNHTTRMRKLLLKRIKKLNSACIVACVWIRTALNDCLSRNEHPARVRIKKSVPRELIMHVASDFEVISLNEGFDQILLVGQK